MTNTISLALNKPRPLALMTMIVMAGCQPLSKDVTADNDGFTAPSQATISHNHSVADSLPLDDVRDFEDARRGLIARADSQQITTQDKKIIWDIPAYGFINGPSPDSANPSLWRQESLNNLRGLFEVTPGIYQLRGFDFANMTIIEGDSGWIIVDPLTSRETASAALTFARAHLGSKPIKAIIFTHAHMDHFGGVLGITNPDEIRQQGIRVIAPEGFMEAATSENIIAGVSMARRSGYMYGKDLPRSPRAHIGSGLGSGPAYGTFGIVTPTEIVSDTGSRKIIDGIEFIFQNAPGSEAPAELTFYLPEAKVFGGAELVSRNMHNLYTLRGAQVRNALTWSNYIDEALTLFGEADIYFGSHHWPMWGNGNIRELLEKQRDLYKYIHDQSVRMLNGGATAEEIAEALTLPDSLNQYFANRGYYGSLSHNAKAVYQYYMGWYNANPAQLNPLPPAQSADRYVEMMGGTSQVLEKAQQYFAKGEYRWVAEILNHLVFAEPGHQDARELLAKTYDQLGYQSEAGSWRNAYLSAAYELRHGTTDSGVDLASMEQILVNTPVDKFFDSMAVRLNGPDAQGLDMHIKLVFTDRQQSYLLSIKNAVLRHAEASENQQQPVNSTLSLTHDLFIKMLIGKAGIKDTLMSDQLQVEGSVMDLLRFLLLFEKPEGNFNIVIP